MDNENIATVCIDCPSVHVKGEWRRVGDEFKELYVKQFNKTRYTLCPECCEPIKSGEIYERP